MQHFIADVTALEALGNTYQNRFFELPSGPYCGRLVAVIQTAPDTIAITWSDNRGLTWSSPQTVASDAADLTCDCHLDAEGNLQVVYTQQTTYYLVTRRLTFSGGLWTPGSTATIYNGASCYDPSIAAGTNGHLWVSWSLYTAPNRRIHVKTSSDNGASWGSGPDDAGQPLSESGPFQWSRLLADETAIHAFYLDQDYGFWVRSRVCTSELWSAAATIATGDSFTKHFDASVGEDGRLGVVFDNDGLFFREFDGLTWGNLVTLDTASPSSPQLLYNNNIPIVVYLQPFAGTELVAMYTDRSSGSFSPPQPMDVRAKPLDRVLLFNAAAGTTQDRTAEAASPAAADVTHSQSGCLLAGAGDAVYLGMDVRWRFARCNLSTPGAGGTIACSYWDGDQWRVFTPVDGNNHLDGSWADLLFWTDYAGAPNDWRKREVDGHSCFWTKLECTSAYTTGPVADQLSAVSRLGRILLRR